MGRRGGCSHSARCTPIRCSRWCRPHAAPASPPTPSLCSPHAAPTPLRCLHAACTLPPRRRHAAPAPPLRRPHAAPTPPPPGPTSSPRPHDPGPPPSLCCPYAAPTQPPRRPHAAFTPLHVNGQPHVTLTPPSTSPHAAACHLHADLTVPRRRPNAAARRITAPTLPQHRPRHCRCTPSLNATSIPRGERRRMRMKWRKEGKDVEQVVGSGEDHSIGSGESSTVYWERFTSHRSADSQVQGSLAQRHIARP